MLRRASKMIFDGGRSQISSSSVEIEAELRPAHLESRGAPRTACSRRQLASQRRRHPVGAVGHVCIVFAEARGALVASDVRPRVLCDLDPIAGPLSRWLPGDRDGERRTRRRTAILTQRAPDEVLQGERVTAASRRATCACVCATDGRAVQTQPLPA